MGHSMASLYKRTSRGGLELGLPGPYFDVVCALLRLATGVDDGNCTSSTWTESALRASMSCSPSWSLLRSSSLLPVLMLVPLVGRVTSDNLRRGGGSETVVSNVDALLVAADSLTSGGSGSHCGMGSPLTAASNWRSFQDSSISGIPL